MSCFRKLRPALTVVLLVSLAFAAGWVAAQRAHYPYLPAAYSDAFTPTFADWMAVSLTARFSRETGLSERLIMTSMCVYVEPDHLFVSVDTETQPAWDKYLGQGLFDAEDGEVRRTYAEGGRQVHATVESGFQGLKQKDLRIKFYIHGSPVGTWNDGVMTLAAQ